jgi:O-antigen/teichoic acid export membrane protein
MLIKHIFSYFISRGLTGIINFVAIALYTRMLTTADYGEYALIVATAGFISAILFQWIRLVLLRFLSKYKKEKKEHLLLGTLFTSYIVTLIVLILITSLAVFLNLATFYFAISMLLLTISQSIFEIILEILRSSLYSKVYGILSVLKSLISLVVALLLIKTGLGSLGVIIGLILGSFIPVIYVSIFRKEHKISLFNGFSNFNYDLLKEFLGYGLPLTATLSMSFIMNQSDRLLLGWLVGKSETGIYSVSYDLTQQTIIMLMMVVNLAAYPLCIRALENEGVEAAQKQVRSNATALFLIAIPSTVGMVMLADSISSSVLGKDFSTEASDIIPIVAISVLFQGVKAYYFDLSFQLGRKTSLQFWPVLCGGIINIVLNFILIPLYTITGAVYATLISYIVAIFLSWKIGKRIFPLPFPFKDFVKITMSSFLMGIPLYFLNTNQETLYGLIWKIGLGAFIYFITIFVLNVWNIREQLGIIFDTIKKKRSIKRVS